MPARGLEAASIRAAAITPAVALPESDKPGHASEVAHGHRNRVSRRKQGACRAVQFDRLHKQRRFGRSGVEALLGKLESLVDRYRNVVEVIAGASRPRDVNAIVPSPSSVIGNVG